MYAFKKLHTFINKLPTRKQLILILFYIIKTFVYKNSIEN